MLQWSGGACDPNAFDPQAVVFDNPRKPGRKPSNNNARRGDATLVPRTLRWRQSLNVMSRISLHSATTNVRGSLESRQYRRQSSANRMGRIVGFRLLEDRSRRPIVSGGAVSVVEQRSKIRDDRLASRIWR